ncbi:MAG: excinuclease ABC subunit UvrC [Dehalococcoidia bacterium]
MANSNVELYLKLLPNKPGIYIFKDARGEVIYVGKASNLHNRVKSYFKQTPNLPEKTEQLAARADRIDFIVTESEIAALILECQLIKKYRPHFNVLLKDDKSFPYIKVDVKNEWPTINITRRRYNDGARYIGRIPSAWSARQTYDLIRKIFPLRSCNKAITGKETRPCLKFHIGRCLGPCIGAISREEYGEMVRRTVDLLEGKEELVVRELKAGMKKAAENTEFEKAAEIRDQIQSIQSVIASNKITFNVRGEQDVISLARDRDIACVRIFSVKDSRLTADEHFIIEKSSDESGAQLLESFIKLYYSSIDHIPGLILIQSPINETALLSEWLASRKGAAVEIRVPHKGAGLRLMEMVGENARQQLEIYKSKKMARPEYLNILSNLKTVLNIAEVPHRIEAYDISNIQGTSSVGSLVVFDNGIPKPSLYRRFKIKLIDHTDDYAMMREVLQRRFKGYVDAVDKWSVLPDLVLIDGGKGHLNAARAAMKELGVDRVPIISIAKENEDIFQPGRSEPVPFDKSSEELHLLQRVRDEAHRFAVTYHRQLRSKKSRESQLDSVAGIGPARKKALIKKFGSVRNIKGAAIEELVTVDGINEALARTILESLV